METDVRDTVLCGWVDEFLPLGGTLALEQRGVELGQPGQCRAGSEQILPPIHVTSMMDHGSVSSETTAAPVPADVYHCGGNFRSGGRKERKKGSCKFPQMLIEKSVTLTKSGIHRLKPHTQAGG
jgi:hypothetical protein